MLQSKDILVAISIVLMSESSLRSQDVDHWAFQNLTPTDPPEVQTGDRLRSPVDAFVLAKLEAANLGFSPDADRPTLIRRLYLDLVGMPPDTAEIDQFLNDQHPNAWERLVERVLQSPGFGERWARHWLDVVGYADTVGFDMNPDGIVLAEGKWRYRDYVINSLNSDKPYDVFIRQQLAGDEAVDWRNAQTFTPEIIEHLVATGFLRTAQDFSHEPISDIPANHYAVIHDTLEIVGTSLFAVTLKCARCHDHKYDPLPQSDYYSLMAILAPAYNSKNWKAVIGYRDEVIDRSLPDVSAAGLTEMNRHNEPLDREISVLKEQLDGLPAEAETEKLESQISTLELRRLSPGRIQALWDVGPAPATHVHIRGSYEHPGDEVQPGFLTVLDSHRSDVEHTDVSDRQIVRGQTSGRRTALANWVTRPDTPASALLARVMVNRIWMHLMGKGLVPSSGNFGLQATPPTHPELLEWLSANFERSGWSIKQCIRQLVASTVYRQSSHCGSAGDATAESVDPGNHLLWRMRLRRVDAEVVRDSLLSIAGSLNPEMGGPAVRTQTNPDGRVVEEQTGRHRRSIYLLVRRAYNPSLLTVFDQPVIGTTCSERQPSAVVSQSLMMLNDEFLSAQAEQFSQRVRDMAGMEQQPQIETAFRLAVSRKPTDTERRWCLEYLQQQTVLLGADENASAEALVDLCHAILNMSEFLYAE
ncbi:MAG: DUF1549 and DUF1553 domain-containing protein [Fuerstiella sp.]|nr:DUF1549 and DUF1553 domain-containing protein [Fuerstiella sp.]